MADEERKGEKAVPGETDELPEATLDEIVGCTGYRGPALSLEEMEEAIEREAPLRRCPSAAGPPYTRKVLK